MVCAKNCMVLAVVGVFATMTSSAFGQQVISAQPIATQLTAVPTHVSTGATAGSYYCPKCNAYHASPSGGSVPTASTSHVTATGVAPAGYYQPTSATTSLRGSSGGTQNVLATLNAQRARQGLSALSFDSQLQAVAERRAQMMAQSGTKGHPSGSFSPGRYEGVGWSSSYSPSGVSACYTSDPNMRVAGAAMATGRDGVYFCVVYR